MEVSERVVLHDPREPSGSYTMSKIRISISLFILALASADLTAQAQDISTRALGTHQIDRFEAIHVLQVSLQANPKDTAGWIVLGELAHEVAQDLSSASDERYYKMSLEAYEKALALHPDNAALRAAVEFARDQEAGATQWDKLRRQAALTFIKTRKEELTTSGFSPTVLVYPPPRASAPSEATPAVAAARVPTPPSTALATTAASSPAPATASPAVAPPTVAPYQTYAYPVYQAYYVQGGRIYTYQQYAGGYLYAAPVYTYEAPRLVATSGAHRRRSER
jgi:hypothetical protein